MMVDRFAWRIVIGWLVLSSAGQEALNAQEPGKAAQHALLDADARPNLIMPTLGGKQFWADELLFHDWRIQRNVFSGHYRLLDGTDQRHAWGTFDQCRQRLEAIRLERRLPPMQGEAVIVLHGLMNSRSWMEGLCQFLREKGGYTVLNVGYPSTRGELRDHAQSLARVLAHLEGIDRIHFVAQSLGNLVVRQYLGDATDPARGRRPDPRIGRFVMLGPPNHGAELAQKLVPPDFAGQIAGRAIWQIAHDWPRLERQLATPGGQFGILAGGRTRASGFNPLLAGDNDLIVSVQTTRLAGARDFRVLPVWHPWMMNNAQVQEYTLRFLKHGYFEADDKRQPVVKEWAAEP